MRTGGFVRQPAVLAVAGAVVVAAVVVPLVLLRSGSGPEGPTGPSAGSTVGVGTTVCLVSNAEGLDDRGFNQAGAAGVREARTALGVTGILLDSHSEGDYAPNLRICAERGADLVVTMGAPLADATMAAARANPSIRYAIVDVAVDRPGAPAAPPNVEGITFRLDQAAFLAGYLAARMSKSGRVGTFGGVDRPSVTDVMNGFAAGVLDYNAENGTNVHLLGWDPAAQDGRFTKSFTNDDQGRRVGEQLIARGADVLLPVAGPAGLGAAAVAQAAGNVMLIGTGTDQFVSEPRYDSLWLTTVEKRIDAALVAVIRGAVTGGFEGGGDYVASLANGGVGLSPFHDFDTLVPQGMKNRLGDLADEIAAGAVSVDPSAYL